MHTPHLMPGGDPFFYPGGKTGCLVLHGFTGAPQEVRWLGQHLNKQGLTILGPRLAGHGARPNDMRGIRWQEWLVDALAGYHALQDHCDRVFVAGLSMGGVLSLLLASHQPDIAGVVAMATPYAIAPAWQRPIAKIAGMLGLMRGKADPPGGDPLSPIIRAEQIARGQTPTGRAAYPIYPYSAIDQLWALLDENRAAFPRVTCPVLLINSTKDEVVPMHHPETIFNALGSADKQRLTLHNSTHVLTEDIERETVFKAVTDFIQAHGG